MTKTIYISNRVFVTSGKTAIASVSYEIGEMKSSIGITMSVIKDDIIIEVVRTFDDAIQLINEDWEQVKMETVDKTIDKELKEKRLIVEFP